MRSTEQPPAEYARQSCVIRASFLRSAGRTTAAGELIVSPGNVMRISEFSHAASVYQKRSVVACIVPLSIALLCIIVYAPLQRHFESFLSTRFDAFWADVLTVLPMAVPTVLAIMLIIPLARRVERHSGIACPHCTKALANHKAIVIASRNCPYCGKRVIEDET